MKPNRTFPSIPDDIRQWTRFLSDLFFAREFTATLSGVTVDQTGTARYTVSAGVVCLSLPDLSGISNSVNAFIDGLPDDITPAHDQVCLARIIDNGVTAVNSVLIGIDTGITLFNNLTTTVGGFTAAGTKGIRFSNVVYPLD